MNNVTTCWKSSRMVTGSTPPSLPVSFPWTDGMTLSATPGKTAGRKALTRAIGTVQERFGLGRVIVVRDRAMVSVENLLELEEVGLE